MKKTLYFISAMAALSGTVSSCSKFFDREPGDEFDAARYFVTETDLRYYTNSLIDAALPSAATIAIGNDQYTDFCATRSSETFFLPGAYNAGIASGWSYSDWSFLRKVAYMLDNMDNAKGNVTEAVYNHYEGVARFFRAMATFNKVKKFGDCFWIDHVVGTDDDAILYGERQDREYIMHNVIEDLAFACSNCLASGDGVRSDGCIYINRYTALALASRICLFEGTYRKYHSVNPSTGLAWNGKYESSSELLALARDYAKALIDSRVFSIHPNFRDLFVSDDFSSTSDEVIWGLSSSDALGVKHNVTYTYCSSTAGNLASPTKEYVMMFLRSNGTPWPSGAISLSKEMNGRDNRLTATVLGPSATKKSASGASVAFTPNFTWSVTGYIWYKWLQTSYEAMSNSRSASTNSLPVIRYSEVLLNYAEAAAELGEMTSSIWDQTVGALRRIHGGLSYTGYPGSSGYVADSWLRSYYTEDVLHPAELSDFVLEIRRERAVELMLENGARYDDLMRWNVGDLIERRYRHQGWRGVYFTAAEAASGVVFHGVRYTVAVNGSNSSTSYPISNDVRDGAYTLSYGTYGYLVYNYGLEWKDRNYLYPIPATAQNVNPLLGQNEGWQWQ